MGFLALTVSILFVFCATNYTMLCLKNKMDQNMTLNTLKSFSDETIRKQQGRFFPSSNIFSIKWWSPLSSLQQWKIILSYRLCSWPWVTSCWPKFKVCQLKKKKWNNYKMQGTGPDMTKSLGKAPRVRTCYICGRGYGLSSFDIHIKVMCLLRLIQTGHSYFKLFFCSAMQRLMGQTRRAKTSKWT